MLNFVAVVHILLAVALIILVLVQDSKGGGALGIGGGGSNSLLGATGAQSLAAKMTRVAAGLFAVSCLYLSFQAGQGQKSVLDTNQANAQVPPTTGAPAPTTGAPTATTPVPTPTTPGNGPIQGNTTSPATPGTNGAMGSNQPVNVQTGTQPTTTTTTTTLPNRR
ncbi:MAG: preprotein translocase subunit SecG [Bdellovibrionota bacterium]